VFIASKGHWKWSDNIWKRGVCSDSMTKFSYIQFLYETRLYRGNAILEILYSKLKKIIGDSRILVDEKASDFVLSWTFVQKLLLACKGVLLKKRCGNAVPTPNIKEDWFVYKNFHTGSSCFTLVLRRCYTRDNLSFIHICCSRRYT